MLLFVRNIQNVVVIVAMIIGGIANAQPSNTYSDSTDILFWQKKATSIIKNNPGQARFYLIKALKQADETLKENTEPGIRKKIATLYNELGHTYDYEQNFSSAKESYSKALEFSTSVNDTNGIAISHYNIGRIYANYSYPDALQHYLKALPLFESGNNKERIILVLNNIALVFDNTGDHENALKYYNQALKYAEADNESAWLAPLLQNIGTVHFNLRNYEKARDYYLKGLEEARKFKDEETISGALNNLGSVANQQRRFDEARKYFDESLIISEITGNRYNTALALTNIGTILHNQGKHHEAMPYLKKSLEIFSGLENLEELVQNHKVLGDVYEDIGDKSLALKHYKIFAILKDSLFNESKYRQLAELTSKYEAEKKDLEISLLTEKTALQQSQINKKDTVLRSIAICSLLVILIIILWYRQRQLSALNKASLLEQKLLRVQMNPHFIFNSLMAIQGYLVKNDSDKAMSTLSKYAKLTRLILNYSRTEHITLEQEIQGIRYYLELQQVRFEGDCTYNIQISEDIDEEEILIPPMLIQPFLENSIEHGSPGKTNLNIEVRFYVKDELLVAEVEDNGVGLRISAEHKKISGKDHKSLATELTRERLAMFSRKKKNKVHLQVKEIFDDEGNTKGTKATLMLPLTIKAI